ncbi:MAG: ammonium transporter, partial [Deltaproteobacteria bacterium]|nr:ammonium transporter [Deltaproteobacteria bacterium]
RSSRSRLGQRSDPAPSDHALQRRRVGPGARSTGPRPRNLWPARLLRPTRNEGGTRLHRPAPALRFQRPDVTMMANGMLAGMVAITAPCAFVSAPAAVLIGAIAGVLVVVASLIVEHRLKIDDPVRSSTAPAKVASPRYLPQAESLMLEVIAVLASLRAMVETQETKRAPSRGRNR